MIKKECAKKELEEDFLKHRTSYRYFDRLLNEETIHHSNVATRIQLEILKEIQFLNDKNISRQ